MKKPSTKAKPKASKPRPLPPVKFGEKIAGGRDAVRLVPRKGKVK